MHGGIQMIIIGICGGSGSGKSTLAKEIKKSVDCSCIIISLDSYYKDLSSLSFEDRCAVNYDAPEIFDYDELHKDVLELLSGRPVAKKGYDFVNHIRSDSSELIQPADVLIIEGIHSFYDERIYNLMDLKIYMNVDTDECLLRRIKRDINKRGRTLESVINQYRSTVKPMYEQYVSKYITRCDVAVMRGGKNQGAIDAVCAYINAKNAPSDLT